MLTYVRYMAVFPCYNPCLPPQLNGLARFTFSMDVKKDINTISQYLSDESNAFAAEAESIDAIYYPESEQELAEILATTRGRVTTSGAGTGITGSRVPIHGGIVISTEKMIQASPKPDCEEISQKGLAGKLRIFLDEEKGLAHIAPGISLSELATALPPGWIYPPDPTETSASIGGTVATNASGARCFNFGPTRNWIQGLRIVLADGEILNIQRGNIFTIDDKLEFTSEAGKNYNINIPNYHMPDIKNSAGIYSKPGMDLIDLFIGSEGILGIISEITIKLHRMISQPVSDLGFFNSEDNAFAYVNELRLLRGKGVLAIEYMDSNSLNFLRDEYPELREGLRAAVFAAIKGDSMEIMDKISNMLAKHNAIEDWCAHTFANQRDLKEFRHSLPDGINAYLRQHDSYKLGTDFVVPVDKFYGMMDMYREIGQRFKSQFPRDGTHYVIFGHIGDCHVHFNFITASEEERTAAKQLYLELARHAIGLGGTISGEHGVGKKTLPVDGKNVAYLELMYGEAGLREIAQVKRALDPELRLNLGNMVPAEFFD